MTKAAVPHEIVVPLIEPLTGHGGKITEVKLRAPRHGDLMEIGDPYVVIRLPDGNPHVVTEPQAVKAYIARCVVSPDPLILEQMGLADSMKVRRAMLDFFEKAVALSAG